MFIVRVEREDVKVVTAQWEVMPPKKPRKALFPVAAVIASGYLTRPRHKRTISSTTASSKQDNEEAISLYYEVRGNPVGVPVVLMHGGPGYYTTVEDTQLFDPAVFQIVAFDQRGSGKSLPPAHSRPFDWYQDVTVEDIVEDAEALRQALSLDGRAASAWCVAGWSWGSAVALLYAETYPRHTLDILLQGVYTGSPREHAPLFRLGRLQHREAFDIFRWAMALALGVEDARTPCEEGTARLDAMLCGEDPLLLHSVVRDYILLFAALQHEHFHCDTVVGPTVHEATGHSHFRAPAAPCRCGITTEPASRRPCCIELAHRVLAIWSLFENVMTYPADCAYFLEKMRRAADLNAPYRASNKDITGALMQLFLFPRMMTRGACSNNKLHEEGPSALLPREAADHEGATQASLLDPASLCRIEWTAGTRLWIVHGKHDAVCPPEIALALAEAVRSAVAATRKLTLKGSSKAGGSNKLVGKQKEGPRRRLHACSATVSLAFVEDAAHDAVDGSGMQAALLAAADEMSHHALERWLTS